MASVTLQKMVYRVRNLLADYSPSDPKVATLPQVLDALDRALFAVSGKLPGYIGMNNTIVTLAAGTASVALSGDYHTLNNFQLASTGAPVRVVSMPTVMRYREGSPALRADPLLMAFTETAAGVVTAEIWPTAWQADTIKGLRALAPSETFRGQSSADLTASSLSFGPYGIEAIAYRAAGELFPPRSDPQEVLFALARESVKDELVRISRQRSSSVPATVGWQ